MVVKNRGKPRKPRYVRASRKKAPAAVILVSGSDNRKTGPIAVTYAAQASCPLTCPFLGNGCYAEGGPMNAVTARLESAAGGLTPDEMARTEAALIDAAPASTDLRLHGVGDCRTNTAAWTVAAAATRYAERGRAFNVKVYGYTHAWRAVDRCNWMGVSMLASVETYDDAAAALDRGYAPAIVVPEFPDGPLAYTIGWDDARHKDVTVVPCPYQTKGVQCVKCRLCMDDAKLVAERRVIAFAAHGGRASTVKRKLEVINGG